MPPFTVNFVALTLLKRNTRTMLSYEKGLTTEPAVMKIKLSKPPPTGIENYQYLQQTRKRESMNSFKGFLRWYNNTDVLPTLEAMQKKLPFTKTKISIC